MRLFFKIHKQVKKVMIAKSMQSVLLTFLALFLLSIFQLTAQTTIASFNFDNDVETGWTYDAWGLNGDQNRQCSWNIGEPNGGQGYNDIRGQRGFIGNPDPLSDNTSDNTINFVAGQGLTKDSKKEGESGYYNNSSEWLMSPAINCADYYNISLEYYRWANFEPGYDYAFIEVSTNGSDWNEVFAPTTLEDDGWVKHTVDVSKYADRESTVYIRWRSESDNSIFYAGWNIDDIKISGVYNVNDNTSSISSGNVVAPSTISSLSDTYSEKITIGEFIITDAGSGDNLATIIDSLVIKPGTRNSISDWKKAITNIYLFEAATGTEISGTVNNDVIYFSNSALLTIPDGSSRTYELSFYVEPNLSSINDNDQFEFVLDYSNVITNPFGSLLSSGVLSTGTSKLFLTIQATQLSFLVEPEQLVSVNRDLLPYIKVAATDQNGNIDLDYSGVITLSNSGNLSMTGNSENTISGVATFSSCQFTQTGGPVIIQASHSGSSSIVDNASNVSVVIEESLSNAIFFDNFDNSGITGWTSGATYGNDAWEVGEPNGGRGYSNIRGSKGYVGNADPTRDYSTDNTVNYVYGQGLGSSSKTEGVSGYFNSSENWLMTPTIDLTNYYNTQLTFRRWANMEPYYDTAFVEISIDGSNWIDLEHPLFPTDSDWKVVYFDISSIADRQPTVYIRWRMVSDGSIYYSGWNLDDVEINGIFSPVTNWTGTVSTDWNTAQNWSSGIVPTRLSNVFIESGTPFKPEVSTVAECNEIVIRKNASLEIKSSGELTVFGDVKIETDKLNYGAIVDNGILVVHGTGKVTRYLTARQWHYISTPIKVASSTQFGEEFYSYDEPTASNNWNNGWVLEENKTLKIGRGYDVYKFKDDIVNLEGEFNTGNYSIAVTNTDGTEVADHEGWNLIGNPYPSAIDWDASGWTKTNIDDAIYIWDEDQQNFVTYISGVGTNGGSRYIPPMQGFFVRVPNPGNGLISMNNNVRITNTDSKFKSTISTSETGIKIRLTGLNYTDETIVRFTQGANSNFDSDLDAYKKFSDNSNVPQVYTQNGKEEFMAINTLPTSIDYTEIPVFISVSGAGTYSLKFYGAEQVDPTKTVYLEDTENDTLIDLLKSDLYTFSTAGAVVSKRFIIHVGMPLMLKHHVTNVSGFGMSDGAIDLTVYGGEQPISKVIWSTGANSEDINGLKAGTYYVSVKDANNNILIDTIEVEQPLQGTALSVNGSEENDDKFLVYEVDRQVHIKPINTLDPIEEIQIYDIEGRIMYHSNELSFGKSVVQLTNPTQGLYVVRIKQNGAYFIEKLVLK